MELTHIFSILLLLKVSKHLWQILLSLLASLRKRNSQLIEDYNIEEKIPVKKDKPAVVPPPAA